MGYSGIMLSPPMPPKPNLTPQNISMEMFRDLIYNVKDPFKRELIKWDKVTYRKVFEELLDEMFKLTRIAEAYKSYDSDYKISYVQPEFNKHQQLRCYVSDSYIVVEVNPAPTKTSGDWMHIIENHGANEKGKSRYEYIKIMQDLSKDVWKLVLEGVRMCVKTLETHLFGLVNNQPPTYEKMKLIRIGQPTEEELREVAKAEAWAKIEVLKQEKALNVAAKAEKRKQFWNNLLGVKAKISFS